MLVKLRIYGLPQGIEDYLGSLSSSQLGSGNEIAVSRHQYQCICLPFQCNGGNIYPKAHIHTFLAQ